MHRRGLEFKGRRCYQPHTHYARSSSSVFVVIRPVFPVKLAACYQGLSLLLFQPILIVFYYKRHTAHVTDR